MTRLKTIAWLLVVLAVLMVLIAPDLRGGRVDRPTTANPSSNGIAALARWFEASGIEYRSLRQRFRRLARLTRRADGNLAIVHLPVSLFLEADEIGEMMRWVADGNTLLVVTAHLEGGDWVYQDRFDLRTDTTRLTGLELAASARFWHLPGPVPPPPGYAPWWERFENPLASLPAVERARLASVDASRFVVLEPTSADALVAGLDDLVVPADNGVWRPPPAPVTLPLAEQARRLLRGGAQREEADPCPQNRETPRIWRYLRGRDGCTGVPTAAHWELLMRHRDAPVQPAMYRGSVGRGEVIVSLHASLLANEFIHRDGNRRFMMRLVQTRLAEGGVVLVDDAHQGLNNVLEAGDLLSDARFWASLGFLLLFWAAWLVADDGSWQRALRQRPVRGLSRLEMVRGAANFLRQRLCAPARVEAVVEPLRAQLARKWQLPPARALAEGLPRERAAAPEAVAALETLLQAGAAGRRIRLLRLERAVAEVSDLIR